MVSQLRDCTDWIGLWEIVWLANLCSSSHDGLVIPGNYLSMYYTPRVCMALHFLPQVLSMLDGKLYTEINPLFSELLLARVFYHSKRTEQNHLQTVIAPSFM